MERKKGGDGFGFRFDFGYSEMPAMWPGVFPGQDGCDDGL
jgi:hypothetical protein